MLPTRRSKASIGRRTRLSGMTIAEIVVASGILLLLFAAITMIYSSSARVWRKVDLRTSLLREAQIAARNLERGIEISHPFGIARADNAIAYISATDQNDDIHMNSLGELLWQRFVIIYIDPDGRMRKRVLPLGTPTSRAPSFVEETGVALRDYLTTGPEVTDRHLTHSGRITRFSLENSGHYGSLFELTIEGEQLKNSTDTENLTVTTKVSVRN
jgi:hypothetical protein